MVTTTPNALVSPIHPTRMPVIVPPAHHETWLTGSVSEAQDCLVAYPAENMRIVRQGTDEKQDPLPET